MLLNVLESEHDYTEALPFHSRIPSLKDTRLCKNKKSRVRLGIMDGCLCKFVFFSFPIFTRARLE